MLAQAMALQQANHGQRQQDDQRQIARLDEACANHGQHLVERKARRKSRADGGHDDHQHGVKAQRKAGNDDEHADQRPQVDVSKHVDFLIFVYSSPFEAWETTQTTNAIQAAACTLID